ncbi:hypothetical protein GCM10011390_00240 [Aureimonas endophytica]|uniref:YicC family protein n=1 Tax=Aureimonas endophytica TaxID=2027858 RepID=A0A916ZB68_9HYPH|nr:YicC/YloC family endoribonuclease [Aureimonas endophytica]GGD85627.1 hypothetical protein GCM10011390_00240 [Aureimonas endophytica]
MPVASMTGFARAETRHADESFVFELRAVNGKGLELRLRLPPGFESLEPEIRRLAASRLTRGNVQIALSAGKTESRTRFSVNEAVLAEVLALSDRLVAAGHAVTPTADGLLSLRGVIENGEAGMAEAAPGPERIEAAQAGFAEALEALVAARRAEGAAIADVLRARLDEMAILVERAERDPARQPNAIRERLDAQLALLLQGKGGQIDEARLLGEVALLATRADIREELDRLRAHLDAARALLNEGGAIGRRLDFLSQEFNREANTLCSKSNATSLTAIGLELKVVVDQFREQVQNIE